MVHGVVHQMGPGYFGFFPGQAYGDIRCAGAQIGVSGYLNSLFGVLLEVHGMLLVIYAWS